MIKNNKNIIIKNIIYSLIIGNEGNLNLYKLPNILNDQNTLKIEDYQIFNKLMKDYNNNFLDVEEIISDITSQYLEYIINLLIDNEIILLNI